jgi:hypothetical protein
MESAVEQRRFGMGERRSTIERILQRIEEHVENWRQRDAARHAEADAFRDRLWAEAAERERLLAEAVGTEEARVHRGAHEGASGGFRLAPRGGSRDA